MDCALPLKVHAANNTAHAAICAIPQMKALEHMRNQVYQDATATDPQSWREVGSKPTAVTGFTTAASRAASSIAAVQVVANP